MQEPVRVWIGDVGAWDDNAALAPLVDAERARAERIRHTRARLCYVASHAALRQLLATSLQIPSHDVLLETRPCRHCGAPHGKPAVVGAPMEFNLSHSGSWFAVALHPTRSVGIDIETRRPQRSDDLAPRFFTAHEHAAIVAGERFQRVWCRKEAVLKASALGLAGGLNSFDAMDDRVRDPTGDWWYLVDLVLDDLDGAVAVSASGPPVDVTVHKLLPA